MDKVKTAVILCAGKSKRYGVNKLNVKILGKTLPQRAVEFCIANGIERVYVTISKDQFSITNGTEISHEVMDDLKPYGYLVDLRFAFQADDEYGPGAAIKPWLDRVCEPFVVLFGDNFYHGELPDVPENVDCLVSYRDRGSDPRNLQLAVIHDKVVIEKPHPFVKGMYFCGYVIFRPYPCRSAMQRIRRSDRNEFEITDLINATEDREFVENTLLWGDITYIGDEEKIAALIKGNDLE